MSERIVTWKTSPRKHEAVNVPTAVSVSQSSDGTTTVTQSGFVDQCGLCSVPWPCMPARIAELEAAFAAATTRAEAAEAVVTAYREWEDALDGYDGSYPLQGSYVDRVDSLRKVARAALAAACVQDAPATIGGEGQA